MATLKEPVKIFIVQSLACRDTPQEVADLVKQEFGLVIDRSQVALYDPTIPHGEARSDTDMTNAQIGYIQETGSPAMNLEARAFLAPGVEDCQEQIAAQLTKAIDQALAGNSQGVDRCLNRAGMIAQNSVRAKINSGDFAPLSEATLRARRRAGKTRTKPLIDTTQLRSSITCIIKKVEK